MDELLKFETAFTWKAPKEIKVKPGPRVSRRMKKYMKKIGQWKYKGKINFTYLFLTCDDIGEMSEEDRTTLYNNMVK